MTRQLPVLPADCISEILEHLDKDICTLHSCLLVDRLWCKISVKILWRDVWNCKYYCYQRSILSTLVACLPKESKELLHEREIFISTPTPKPPSFSYEKFCKVLPIYKMCIKIENVLNYELPPTFNIKERNFLVINEIIKMYTNQIYSLKKLTYYNYKEYRDFSFTCFPGVRSLSELGCSSNLPSDFFNQMSQICQNLQSISIRFNSVEVSNDLKELISLQNNLKHLTLTAFFDASWKDIIPSLTKHLKTITKLYLYSDKDNLSLSFVSSFSNLQEIMFSFYNEADFKDLQYAHFPRLQILKIPYRCYHYSVYKHIMKFLETNGSNLKKFHTHEHDPMLSLSIPRFCTNLRSLFIILKSGELNTLANIFTSCQYLESIGIWCGCVYLSEEKVLEIVADHAPTNFCELKIYNISNSEFVTPEDLELFFMKWNNRTPKKLFSLIVYKSNYNSHSLLNERSMKVIKKYERLGVTKLAIKMYREDAEEEEIRMEEIS
ncbi:hypothetical protein RclHR1_10340001 [Rhizophagus clarus]|uniref:F-box domain-containing protein n=1 Tax=Rhizophagus clarus TaxID=94130 RepID=A0A2Z6QSE1_9GLOM|nr:hypothetical protein RclHR1_10340001 [Rhizophagus clarus]GES83899.1 hypothetical protein GLOIN_2v1784405 [Rhizophagus clarus]